MKTSSAKAKGRRLQQKVAAALRETFSLAERDCKSTPMGTQGEDVYLSSAAWEKFPFAIECKNTESINIWKAWAQAKTHAGTAANPMVIFSKNHEEILVTLKFETLLEHLK
jgi:hypothetical protein